MAVEPGRLATYANCVYGKAPAVRRVALAAERGGIDVAGSDGRRGAVVPAAVARRRGVREPSPRPGAGFRLVALAVERPLVPAPLSDGRGEAAVSMPRRRGGPVARQSDEVFGPGAAVRRFTPAAEHAGTDVATPAASRNRCSCRRGAVKSPFWVPASSTWFKVFRILRSLGPSGRALRRSSVLASRAAPFNSFLMLGTLSFLISRRYLILFKILRSC